MILALFGLIKLVQDAIQAYYPEFTSTTTSKMMSRQEQGQVATNEPENNKSNSTTSTRNAAIAGLELPLCERIKAKESLQSMWQYAVQAAVEQGSLRTTPENNTYNRIMTNSRTG
jgi:hypothetical protein